MAPVHPQITASNPALESFELSHLNRRALLRKEAHEIMDKWADAEVEARFARWILDCRRAGNFDRLSLAEHSPDLFPDAPPDTLPDAPPHAPMFPPSRGASIPGLPRTAREIPQFLRRASASSLLPVASLPATQLTLPLSLAPASPDRNAVDESRGGDSVGAPDGRGIARTRPRWNNTDSLQRRNIAKTSLYRAAQYGSAATARRDAGIDASENRAFTVTETSRYRSVDSDAEITLRSLEFRSHRNAAVARMLVETCPNACFARVAAQTSSFTMLPPGRTCSSNGKPLESSAAQPSTGFAMARTSSFTTTHAVPAALGQVAFMRVTSKNERAPRAPAANQLARQTPRCKLDRQARTLSRSHNASRSRSSAHAKSPRNTNCFARRTKAAHEKPDASRAAYDPLPQCIPPAVFVCSCPTRT